MKCQTCKDLKWQPFAQGSKDKGSGPCGNCIHAPDSCRKDNYKPAQLFSWPPKEQRL